ERRHSSSAESYIEKPAEGQAEHRAGDYHERKMRCQDHVEDSSQEHLNQERRQRYEKEPNRNRRAVCTASRNSHVTSGDHIEYITTQSPWCLDPFWDRRFPATRAHVRCHTL